MNGLHPLSAFLSPYLADGVPSLESLNALAATAGLVSGGGVPLRFVPTPPGDDGYEAQIFASGQVPTRGSNWHDLYNALIWFSFPQAKAAMNRRHVEALRAVGTARRGPLRDALTQFDECGVVVVGRDVSLWQGIRGHRWQEVFVSRRRELMAGLRFVVFGHASHDALRAPFAGLCGKAIFLNLDPAAPLATIDATLAAWCAAVDLVPRDLQPLPLLGIPGATPDNENADYYADTRQFRPPRTAMPASPDSVVA